MKYYPPPHTHLDTGVEPSLGGPDGGGVHEAESYSVQSQRYHGWTNKNKRFLLKIF